MQDAITCLNGIFVGADEAMLPITDRGFRFGDGVFETIRIEDGVPYQWEMHMERLKSGLNALRIPAAKVDFEHDVRATLHRNHAQNGFLRISVSRGSGSVGYTPLPSAVSNWAIEYLPPRPLPASPFTLWLSSFRRTSPESIPANFKLAHGIGSTLALMEAADNGCEEALQLSTRGLIACAASGNIFWAKGKSLFTPSLETGCLNGTIRRVLIQSAPFPVYESAEDINTLHNADALFITNTRLGIWPIKTLQPLGLTFSTNHPLLGVTTDFINKKKNEYISKNNERWKSLA